MSVWLRGRLKPELSMKDCSIGVNDAVRRWGAIAGKVQSMSALLLVALLTFGMVNFADSQRTLTPSQEPIPPSYFDLNILFHPLTKVPWPAVPFGGWRLSHVNWADLQPQEGAFYWDLLDKYANWGEQHHTEILMTLTFSPQWASQTPDAVTDSKPGISGAPRDMELWRTYVRAVATRYKGRIHEFEIWNEPNRKKSWTGDMDTLITMTREASRILKEVDPNNLVISPPPTGPESIGFFKDFLSKGGAKYTDIIGYHFYVAHSDGPEAMVTLIQQVKDAMHQYNVGEKPLWDTEAGWLGPDFFPDDKQSAYVARAYILNWAARVDRFYWYAWEDHHGTQIELVQKDNSTLTAAGRAFVTIQDWLKGSVMKRCLTSENKNWICEIDRGESSQYIVWNTDGDRSFRLSKDWRVSKVTQLAGGTSPIQGDSIQIGIQPVLIQ
jgi:hypothetical protein